MIERLGQKTMTEHQVNVSVTGGSKVTANASVKRGPESWSYIYTVLGFVVAVEATVIGMMTPLTFPWNIVLFVIVAAITIWQFIENGWLHNKLIGLKIRYENKAR